jgi:hypothetical protein
MLPRSIMPALTAYFKISGFIDNSLVIFFTSEGRMKEKVIILLFMDEATYLITKSSKRVNRYLGKKMYRYYENSSGSKMTRERPL